MIKAFVTAALTCLLVLGPSFIDFPRLSTACAQNDWRSEFDDICSKTENPGALTKSELQTLISRCDALKPRIVKLDETSAKVYLRRLEMCRNLFVFVLELQAK